jgi:nitrile hydratase accessory protein
VSVSLDVDGVAAPPRRNGELVFAEPWESRAFGLAMSLHEAGAFGWEDFRQALIARISSWDEPAGYRYYECWVEALEQLLVDRGIVGSDAVGRRAAEVAARPAGWDHGHAH